MVFKRFKMIAAAALIAGSGVFLTAPTVGAATLNFYNDAATSTTLRATGDCGGGSCAGLIEVLFVEATTPGTAIFDSVAPFDADLVTLSGQSSQDEADWINLQTGLSISKDDVEDGKTGVAAGAGDNFTLTTFAEWILLKIGTSPNVALIHNLAGNPLVINYSSESGSGAGLSHYTEIAAVPLPAAGVLLIGALGGLVALRRRRKIA